VVAVSFILLGDRDSEKSFQWVRIHDAESLPHKGLVEVR
jgi:hypothetical protein